jgi:hypothetical protein
MLEFRFEHAGVIHPRCRFNTIQIAAGSTLKLSGLPFAAPTYFLAQGAVTIAGTLDVSGANGSQPAAPVQNSGFTVPGPADTVAALGHSPEVRRCRGSARRAAAPILAPAE